jgi:hypothetical protein
VKKPVSPVNLKEFDPPTEHKVVRVKVLDGKFPRTMLDLRLPKTPKSTFSGFDQNYVLKGFIREFGSKNGFSKDCFLSF